MHDLAHAEVERVSGGIPIFVPVTFALLTDTASWGALGLAYGFGYSIGTGISQTINAPVESMPTSPYFDTLLGGNLGA
jgi:hypothetical protein